MHLYVGILLVLLLHYNTAHSVKDPCPPLTPEEAEKLSSSDLVTKLTAPCRYDRWLRPDPGDGGAVHVHVRIHVYFLGEIQAQNLKFTAHILLMYRWRDPRLSYPRRASDGTMIGPISGQGLLLRDKIWVPHVYLSNERDSVVMGPEKKDVRITLHSDGTVQQSQRMKVTLNCLMNLQKFPFDQQQCPLILESWTYNTSDLRLSWEKHRPVSINTDLLLTEYRLIETRTITEEKEPNQLRGPIDPPHTRLSHPNPSDPNETQAPFLIVDEISEIAMNDDESPDFSGEDFGFYKNLGNFSVLEIRFHLAREVGHYVMDYFMPSILLVGMSWVSFWLDPNAIPGRTTLGTSTMLTFITLTRNTGSALPKVSYIKATEIWFIVCTGFIFGSLLEFAFVNTIWRRKKEVELKKVNSKYILKSTLTPRMARKAMSSSGSVGADLDRCQSWPRVDGKSNSANDVSFYINSNANQLTVNSMDSIRINGDNSTNGGPGFDSCATLTSTTSGPQMDDDCHSVIIPVPGENAPPPKPFTKMTPQEVAHWIDVRSRFWFPIAFLLFNALYWGFVWI